MKLSRIEHKISDAINKATGQKPRRISVGTKLSQIYEFFKDDPISMDKLDNGGGDKGTIHSYIDEYDRLLNPYRHNSTFLEIGIWRGESIRMWNEYFINSTVIGVEIYAERTGGLFQNPDYNIIIADATKPEFLTEIEDYTFDVIIDDGSHYVKDKKVGLIY